MEAFLWSVREKVNFTVVRPGGLLDSDPTDRPIKVHMPATIFGYWDGNNERQSCCFYCSKDFVGRF